MRRCPCNGRDYHDCECPRGCECGCKPKPVSDSLDDIVQNVVDDLHRRGLLPMATTELVRKAVEQAYALGRGR